MRAQISKLVCPALAAPAPHALFFLGFLLLLAARLPAQTPEVPPMVRQWIEAQQHMGDIKVGFKLTRTLPTLKDPIVNEGRFWRLADGRFRWELGTPPSTVLLFNNNDLRVWDAASQSWQTLSATDRRMKMWMTFLNSKEMSAEAMAKDFLATVTGESPVVTIALQPRGFMVKKHLKQVDLQIDPATKHLRQLRIIQSDDATVLMSFGPPQPVPESDKAGLDLQAK